MSLGRTFNYTRKKLYAEKVKGTVKGEASDTLLIECQFRFTTVPLKALSGVSNHYISLFHADLENCLFLDVTSLQKLIRHNGGIIRKMMLVVNRAFPSLNARMESHFKL